MIKAMNGRETGFVVDPQGQLMTILSGTDVLKHLDLAYLVLSDRISKAGKVMSKYRQQLDEPTFNSPVSTAAEYWGRNLSDSSPRNTLFYHVARPDIPKHLNANYPQQPVHMSKSDVVDSYHRDDTLIDAFPDISPKTDPTPFTYNTDGERIDLFRSTSSSYGRDPDDFVLPEEPETSISSRPKSKGKKREEFSDQPSASSYSYAPAAPSLSPIRENMGAYTPYKPKGSNFFNTPFYANPLPIPQHPATYHGYNVLHGMATSDYRQTHEKPLTFDPLSNASAWPAISHIPVRRAEAIARGSVFPLNVMSSDPPPAPHHSRASSGSSVPKDPPAAPSSPKRALPFVPLTYGGGFLGPPPDKPFGPLPPRRPSGSPGHRGNGGPNGPRPPRPPRPPPNVIPPFFPGGGGGGDGGGGGGPGGPGGGGDGGGGGGSGGGGGAPGGGPPPPPPPAGPTDPANPYQFLPRMKNEFRPEDLPKWNGGPRTAIQYFADVQEYAAVGGYVPYQMGSYLWMRLEEGSAVRNWYITLTEDWKAHMRWHVVNYLDTIKTYWLGDRWQQDRNLEFQEMRFRMRGRERENPADFIQRRVLFARMLLTNIPGSIDEVYDVLRTAPISWKNVLQLESINSTAELQVRVAERHFQLIEAATARPSNLVTLDELPRLVKQLTSGGQTRNVSTPFRRARTAQLVDAEVNLDQEENPEVAAEVQTIEDSAPGALLDGDVDGFEDPFMKEAYAILTKRQRPAPKNGYPFPRADDVITRRSKPPPSPCKHCGSEKHWDAECVHRSAAERKAANSVGADYTNADRMYDTVYNSLLNEFVSEDYIEINALKQTFISETSESNKVHVDVQTKPHRKPFVEEIVDEEFMLKRDVLPADSPYIMEQQSTGPIEETHPYETKQACPAAESVTDPPRVSSELPPSSPFTSSPIRLRKWRQRPTGLSALGVSVLSIKGHVGSLPSRTIDLRLDSCADVTLVSEAFLNSLAVIPKIKQGMRMNLFQLTDRAKIKGYVDLIITTETEDGQLIELEAEAYVVPDMKAPILLGEDFQEAYEISVIRNVESSSLDVPLGQLRLKEFLATTITCTFERCLAQKPDS
jgi:hypothetical protein